MSKSLEYVKETKNTLYSAGEYVILANSQPYIDVLKITGISEKLLDSGSGTILKKEFRYSIDSVSFSEFQELTNVNLESIGSFDRIWFQFRYILLSGGPISVMEVSIVFDKIIRDKTEGYIAPSIKDESNVYAFPVTYKSNFLWNPYKMNRAVRLYKDLNLMVNNLFGHDTCYYRVLPQGRSKDVFLMEYSLYDHDEYRHVKLVVPNNEFPDNKLNMGPFGVDFEMPFEIHIDKDYFQKIFGDGSGPQKRDVIYFARTPNEKGNNRVYEVSSSYLYRDFMNEPLYYKVTLIKWLPKSNVSQNEIVDTLEDFTVSAGKLFGDLIEQEEKKVTNPEQFKVATTVSDPVRSSILPEQVIGNESLVNYYTVIAEHFYKMESSLSLKKVRTKIDATYLKKGTTYYARVSSSSIQSDIQLFYSMKKLIYLGQEDGFSIFLYEGGYSQVEALHPLRTIFASGSPYFLYKTEYTETVTEDYETSCDTSIINNYKPKVINYIAKNDFPSTVDRAFSCWFKIKDNTGSKYPVTSVHLDIYSKELTLQFSKPFDCLPGDLISLNRTSGTNFNIFGEVSSVISDTSIILAIEQVVLDYVKLNFSTWINFTDIIAQKSYPRVFLNSLMNGKGIKIELYENRHFVITMNEDSKYFSLPNSSSGIDKTKWYALFINFSNTFKQLTINVWELQWNPVTKIPATTDLKLFYNKTVELARVDRSSDVQYFLEPSYMDLTNVRLFNRVAETDKQVLILNQNIVKDAQWAIIIDNALPPSKLPLIGYTR